MLNYDGQSCSTKILTAGIHSLATAEMRILLREVHSQCSTRISEHMVGDIEMADQIISSRPRDQKCMLAFEKIEALSCSN